jgi:hypothetical protein
MSNRSRQAAVGQRIRTLGISWTVGLMLLVDRIATDSPEIKWQDRLRWFLEGHLNRVFGWFYNGSDEEIQAVYQSEIPLKYMSPRQRAVLTLPRMEYGAHCCHCRWEGWLDECTGDNCPDCGAGAYLDEFEPEGRR